VGGPTGPADPNGDRIAVIRLTAVDPADRQVLEMYLKG
jgi:hypothetical protein